MGGGDAESQVGRGLDVVDQELLSVFERVPSRGIPKGCVPLGICRVEETKGLIDGMGTIGLHGANGHNGSIKGHVVYSMPCNSPWEVT